MYIVTSINILLKCTSSYSCLHLSLVNYHLGSSFSALILMYRPLDIEKIKTGEICTHLRYACMCFLHSCYILHLYHLFFMEKKKEKLMQWYMASINSISSLKNSSVSLTVLVLFLIKKIQRQKFDRFQNLSFWEKPLKFNMLPDKFIYIFYIKRVKLSQCG